MRPSIIDFQTERRIGQLRKRICVRFISSFGFTHYRRFSCPDGPADTFPSKEKNVLLQLAETEWNLHSALEFRPNTAEDVITLHGQPEAGNSRCARGNHLIACPNYGTQLHAKMSFSVDKSCQLRISNNANAPNHSDHAMCYQTQKMSQSPAVQGSCTFSCMYVHTFNRCR